MKTCSRYPEVNASVTTQAPPPQGKKTKKSSQKTATTTTWQAGRVAAVHELSSSGERWAGVAVGEREEWHPESDELLQGPGSVEAPRSGRKRKR